MKNKRKETPKMRQVEVILTLVGAFRNELSVHLIGHTELTDKEVEKAFNEAMNHEGCGQSLCIFCCLGYSDKLEISISVRQTFKVCINRKLFDIVISEYIIKEEERKEKEEEMRKEKEEIEILIPLMGKRAKGARARLSGISQHSLSE